MKKIIVISLICIVFDQFVKLIISNNMNLNSSITLISGFFSLTYVRNLGAAFSILSGNRIFLVMLTFFALFLIYYMFAKNSKSNKDYVIYGLLYGGIIGNLIDRVFRGFVVDFFDFKIFGYNFPVFNVADIFIVVSVFILVITTIMEGTHGKNSSK